MSWKRPSDVPVGHVWRRFPGCERDGKPINMYQIRDIEEEHKPLCIELMKEFIRDEPLIKALGVADDPDSVKSMNTNWMNFLSQNMSIACFLENDGQPTELVAVNILFVKSKGDQYKDLYVVKGEPWKKLCKTLEVIESEIDVFKTYKVEHYLTSSGITVKLEHRGQNIGKEMFAAREQICKTFGIPATATVFTAITSQVLAAKCGFELLFEAKYSEMAEFGIDLGNPETETAKIMGKKFL